MNIETLSFSVLHGMGSELYQQVVPVERHGIPCRIYAPVGSHEDLLPYLVRRLLENGANSSFVNRIVDDNAPISTLVEDPVENARALLDKMNKNIPLPENLFEPGRKNSKGFDFSDRKECALLQQQMAKIKLEQWTSGPIIASHTPSKGEMQRIESPQKNENFVGTVQNASLEDVDRALSQAEQVFPHNGLVRPLKSGLHVLIVLLIY